MTDNSDTNLRERAEAILAQATKEKFELPDDIRKFVYELSVYQTELEIQNDELQRLQIELSGAHDRYKALFDDAPAGYLTVSSNNVIEQANLLASRLFGMSQEELVGKNLIQLVLEEDMDILYLHLRHASQSNVTESCEVKLTASGSDLTVRMDSQKVENSGLLLEKENWAIRTVVTDISESKKRSQLEFEAQQAIQEERLKTLTTVAGGVAHDFNNLLLPITINAELAKESLDTDNSSIKNLESIIEASDAATVLCQQLLDFTGSSHFSMEPLDLDETICNLLPILSSSLPASQSLILDCQSGGGLIMADAVQLKRVLMNLIGNASEAIGDQAGNIQISTSVRVIPDSELEKMVLAEDCSSGEYVVVTIKDDGCGIPTEVMARIFDPFYSTKFSGRGLGLASVFGIARKHGAAIDVSSSPEGTNFQLLFSSITRTAKPATGKTTTNEIMNGTGRILVVDDNAMVRSATEQLLVLAGYEVESVESGFLAIEEVTQQPDRFDLVLLDLMMPEMNGITTLENIRLIAPDILVCMTSGFADQPTLKKLDDLSIDGFIAKPSSVLELTTQIRTAFESKQLAAETQYEVA